VKRWRSILIGLLLLVGAVLVCLHWPPEKGEASVSAIEESNGSLASGANTGTNAKRSTSVLTPIKKAIEANRAVKDSLEQFKTPIEFYGLAIDEVGQPVVDATVSFTWTDVSRQGH
jgi:hypothetical protein